MSELNQSYLQLAAIVGRQNWREDETLLRAFTLWVHNQFGLAWQTVIFSAQPTPGPVKGSIKRSKLHFCNGVLSSVEVETDLGKHKLRASQLRLPALVRMLFLASEVKVQGIEEDELAKLFDQQIVRKQLTLSSGLRKKLMNDFVVTRRGRSRKSRLIAKLRKDPVLFFRDSKGVVGRSVYFLLQMMGKERAL